METGTKTEWGRKALVAGYEISNGIIRSPGKFEAERTYILLFHDDYMSGGGEYISDTRQRFIIDELDLEEFPELSEDGYKVGSEIDLLFSDQGFCSIAGPTPSETIERSLEGTEFFSVGICPGCKVCASELGVQIENFEELWSQGKVEESPEFSWHSCELCRSSLGGDRYPAHAVDKATGDILHFEVCVDCYVE